MRVVYFSRRVAIFCLFASLVISSLITGTEFINLARAQDPGAPPVSSGQAPELAAPQSLPAVVVPAPPPPKPQTKKQQQATAGGRTTRVSNVARRGQAATTAGGRGATDRAPVPVDAGFGGSPRANDPQQVVTADKTGTKLEDLPANVQIIPRELLT